jgi:alcohol dehydrogenase
MEIFEIEDVDELNQIIDYSKYSIVLASSSVLNYPKAQEIIEKFSKKLIITGLPSNPSWGFIRKKLTEIPNSKEQPQIISMGGGSIIDFAKILHAAMLVGITFVDFTKLRNPEQLQFLLDSSNIAISEIQHICFPTTIGSGSEVTHFATVWTDDDLIKFSVSNKSLKPSITILYSKLIEDLPLDIKLFSTLDAISHSCESITSLSRNKESIYFANTALNLIWPGVIKGYELWGSSEFRSAQKGSYFAGKAIDITKTGICHSMSYPLTKFSGVPHGLACAISLNVLLKEYQDQVNLISAEDFFDGGVQLTLDRLNRFISQYNVTMRFREYVSSRKEFESYIPYMRNKQRSDNLHIKFSNQFVDKVIKEIYHEP